MIGTWASRKASALNLLWPREAFYGTEWYQKWGPILVLIVLGAVGLIWYYTVQQHKGDVLEEHRADPLPEPPHHMSAP